MQNTVYGYDLNRTQFLNKIHATNDLAVLDL